MKKIKFLSKLICLQLVFSFIIGMSSLSFADSSEPLALVKSSIVDGGVDIPIDLQIELEFSKNIRPTQEVIDHNKSCVSLKDSNGNNVNINVIMEVASNNQPNSVKRAMSIKPVDTLKNDTNYILTIKGGSNGLRANNADLIMEKDVVINFTTVKAPVVEEPTDPEEPGDSQEPTEPTNPEEPEDTEGADKPSEDDGDDEDIADDEEDKEEPSVTDEELDNEEDETNKVENSEENKNDNDQKVELESNDNPKTGEPVSIGIYAGAMLLSSGILMRIKKENK